MNVTQKILKEHLLGGELVAGNEISISIDQTLTQDSTGTMVYLQFEAMGIDRVQTKKSVAYIDHNTLQAGFENADDHKYIQTVAKKHGIWFSRPGSGICHQVHLERFGVSGETLLGSDSHTPTGGALGMIAIGAGGLDVAVAMGGGAYFLTMPKIVGVKLVGQLQPKVSAKDVILEMLRRLSVKGGVGKIFEYFGEGVKTLTVPQRATITNMGAELGATTSVFPSDEVCLRFFESQQRAKAFKEILADDESDYDEIIEIDLSELEPLVACPHSPDSVVTVKSLEGLKVDQVAIGSCTNSSFADMMTAAAILKGNKINENTSLVISCGSKQVFSMLAKNGSMYELISSGARILECACGPCIGMGQAPASGAVSLRTFNRNFEGRSGTLSAKVYLVSPETAAVSAVNGCLTDPRSYEGEINFEMPRFFDVDDSMVAEPSDDGNVKVVKGPNIKPFPKNDKLADSIKGEVLVQLNDTVTTDDIMPSNASLLPYRSNVPHLAGFCLTPLYGEFPELARNKKGGFIVGGENYGQGSSREHAALVMVELGIKAVLAKSFARIHKANLINNGVLPLEFVQKSDYKLCGQGKEISIKNVKEQLKNGKGKITATVDGQEIVLKGNFTERERQMLESGGLINLTKLGAKK
jgi:aconitate hydratase